MASSTLLCDSLKTVHVEDGCIANVRYSIKESTAISPVKSTALHGQLLWNLRTLKVVVIPDGIINIGSDWFYDSRVKNVTIPSSVEYIGAEVFCNCTELRKVVFLPNSKLKQIDERSFRDTSLKGIIVPSSVTVIREGAFRDCRRLKSITF